MYHIKKIGIFISHIFGKFQTDLCQGIIDKAEEYGYLVEIFSSNDGEELGDYSIGESSVLRIPNYDQFCAVIFASGTYLSTELKDKIASTLKEKCRCPIIDVNSAESTFPTVILDNNNIFSLLVSHMIEVHKYKRICYLGNTYESEFSDKRCAAYTLAMQAHKFAVPKENICNSGYGEAEILLALDYFLDNPVRPDAILCYNDKMAFTLMKALLDKGFRIPEDIAVTGCDNLDIVDEINPRLTTISFPIYELGTTAVELFIKSISGETIPALTIVKAEPLYSASCGCSRKNTENPFFLTYKHAKQISHLEHSLIEDMNMSASLHNVTDIDNGMEILEKYACQIKRCKELYLCLYSDWDSASSQIRELTFAEDNQWESSDTTLLKFALKDKKRLSECSFMSQNTLPEYLYSNSSPAYIYSPLFFENREFGYIALSYEENKIAFRFQFISWLKNVNSMLQNICNNKHMGLLINRLEDVYMRDELTGLYNSHGLHRKSLALLEHAHNSKQKLLAAVLDLDGLKIINDNFGHQEGNFAIQVLGHAIENAAGENDICARAGGDEFYILSCEYDEKSSELLINKIHKYLDHYNALHTKGYNISVSAGCSLELTDSPFSAEELFDRADKLMYLEKKNKIKHILK